MIVQTNREQRIMLLNLIFAARLEHDVMRKSQAVFCSLSFIAKMNKLLSSEINTIYHEEMNYNGRKFSLTAERLFQTKFLRINLKL